jgi:hypothetical protein
MYVPRNVGDPGVANATEFVDFWISSYKDSRQETHYFSQLIEDDLTEENVRKLLKWKDPHYLADRSDGQPNPRVTRVLSHLHSLNQFRRGEIDEEQMWKITADVFPNGFVWRAFLLHIARPDACPIVDRYVLRAWAEHTNGRNQQNWETYTAYRNYFARIAAALDVPQDFSQIRALKRIDNALLQFGGFLEAYLRDSSSVARSAAPNHS